MATIERVLPSLKVASKATCSCFVRAAKIAAVVLLVAGLVVCASATADRVVNETTVKRVRVFMSFLQFVFSFIPPTRCCFRSVPRTS
jgi:hypothetical protein